MAKQNGNLIVLAIVVVAVLAAVFFSQSSIGGQGLVARTAIVAQSTNLSNQSMCGKTFTLAADCAGNKTYPYACSGLPYTCESEGKADCQADCSVKQQRLGDLCQLICQTSGCNGTAVNTGDSCAIGHPNCGTLTNPQSTCESSGKGFTTCTCA